MKKNFIFTSLMVATFYSVPSSIAATQGTLNPTSSGSLEVTLTIPDRVRISGMQDINFGTYTHAGDFNDDYPVCIYTNTPTAQYGVTATGDGAGSAFTLTNGTDTIAYEVLWNETAGTTVGEYGLFSGVKIDNRPGANQQSTDCSTGGNTANLHVRVTENNMQNVTNGTYSGTLTITIDPS